MATFRYLPPDGNPEELPVTTSARAAMIIALAFATFDAAAQTTAPPAAAPAAPASAAPAPAAAPYSTTKVAENV